MHSLFLYYEDTSYTKYSNAGVIIEAVSNVNKIYHV